MRGLYDYLKESKEDMLSGALKENVTEKGETKDEFTKRKRVERKKTLYEGKLQGEFVEKPVSPKCRFRVGQKKRPLCI